MSFFYPRSVTITRPGVQTGEGLLGYGGQTQAAETEVTNGSVVTVAENVPASIQAKGRQGKNDPVGLPGDGTVAMYSIFIPRRALAKGSIRDRDIITDELGVRYQVLSDGWDSLGYQVICQRLQA